MKKLLLIIAALALTGCAAQHPSDCVKKRALDDCAYAPAYVPEVDDLLGDLSSGRNPSPVEFVSGKMPSYPARAQAQRIEGNVRVAVDVDATGAVTNARVVSAVPANIFNHETLSAARKWRFKPGTPADNVILTVTFRLNGGAGF